MIKHIIAIIACAAFWGGFITGQSAFASDIYYKNNNPDLLDINIKCTNTKMTKIFSCMTFASMKYNWNDGVTIQDKFVRSGKLAYVFENAPGECGWNDGWSDCDKDRERTELSMTQFAENGPKWVKFSIRVPSDTKCTPGVSCSLWQLHTKQAGPAYMLRWKHDSLMLTDFPNNDDYYGAPKEHTITTKFNELKDQWLDFVVYIEQYDRPKKGKLIVWLNGEKVIDHYGYRRLKSGKNNYMKFGIYKTYISRAMEEREPMSVYFDSITLGYDCKSLNVKKEGYDCKNFQIDG